MNLFRRLILVAGITAGLTFLWLEVTLRNGPLLRPEEGVLKTIDFHGDLVAVTATDHWLYYWSLRLAIGFLFTYMAASAAQVFLKRKTPGG